MDDYITVTDPDNPILFYELNMGRVDYIGAPPEGQREKVAVYFSGRAEPLLLPTKSFWHSYQLWRRHWVPGMEMPDDGYSPEHR